MYKILVVEDDPDVSENLQEMLELNEYVVKTAFNGREGLQILENFRPDLIISDINMPIMNGWEFLKELRKNVNNFTIPFLFLTAKVEKGDLRYGMELGADDYITKPFRMNDVLHAIETRLSKQEYFRDLYNLKFNDLRKSIAMALPHELRTPLNSILGFSQFMIETHDDLTKEDSLNMLHYIYESGQRLLRLVTNYTYYTNLLIGDNINTPHEKFATIYKDTVEDIVHSLYDKYPKDLTFNINVEVAKLCMSEGQFRKIIEELADNAIKFANNNTEIKIECSQRANNYFVIISNYGILLSDKVLKDVEAFIQFNRNEIEQQGSGLGLIIVKKLIENAGGEITLDDFGGNGARIEIQIPLS